MLFSQDYLRIIISCGHETIWGNVSVMKAVTESENVEVDVLGGLSENA